MDHPTLKTLLLGTPHTDIIEAIDEERDFDNMRPLLEAEVQRSSSRLQRLRELRSTLSSCMYCLPPELLSYIFVIYAGGKDEVRGMQWTKLLLVCRRWYAVAVETWDLWSNIRLSEDYLYGRRGDRLLASAEVHLSRVEQHGWPLTASLELGVFSNEAMRAFLPKVLAVQTLNSLEVLEAVHLTANDLNSLSAHRYPALETLTITAGFDHRRGHGLAALPVKILDRDHTPLLRNLSIEDIALNWSLIGGLRSLRIRYGYIGNDPLPLTYNDYLDVLVRCPLIEEIVLDVVFPTGQTPGDVSPPSISLPYLHTLLVKGAHAICVDLPGRLIDLPCTTKMNIVSALGQPNDDAELSPFDVYSPLVSYLGRHASRKHAPAIRLVALMHLRYMHFNAENEELDCLLLGVKGQLHADRYASNTASTSDLSCPAEESLYIGLDRMRCLSDTDEAEEALTGILQAWPLQQATHVDVRRIKSPPHSNLWRALCDNMPCMTTIIVRPDCDTTRILLEALAANLQTSASPWRVTNIIFDASKVREHEPEWWPTSEAHVRSAMMRALAYCAEAARAGLPLDTIEIINDSKGHLLEPSAILDWSELNKDLAKGFVYEGTLHSYADSGQEGTGVPWTSFLEGTTNCIL